MKISIIGCPFQTTYGAYIVSLRSALQQKSDAAVQWVGTNCGCGDPIADARQFETRDNDYFEMRDSLAGHSLVAYTTNPLKRALRAPTRLIGNTARAKRYVSLAANAEVMHLQQTLAAFGSDVTFRFLRQNTGAARVITVHELDAEQTDNPGNNLTYNQADALIVHDAAMKKKLVALGVTAERVHVVCQGTNIQDVTPVERSGIVYYGGHHFDSGKGIDVLLKAYRLLKDRHSGQPPRLSVHGHYGTTPAEIHDQAKQLGVDGDIDWLDEVAMKDLPALYRRSLLCVLPYRRSFAGLPVGVAAANQTPIIATRAAGIPEHIGDLGLWVGGENPTELADRIDAVIKDAPLRENLGARLRARAEQYLGWDVIASNTLAVYEAARETAAKRLH